MTKGRQLWLSANIYHAALTTVNVNKVAACPRC